MKTQSFLEVILVVVVSLVSAADAPLTALRAPQPASHIAYIEPALLSYAKEPVSVIVTATNAQAAARAVESAGGRVISKLWLIDAVAARVPAGRLRDLAAYPEVKSIVHNKSVSTANGEEWISNGITFATDQAWPVAVDVGADQLHRQGINRNTRR